MREVRIEAGDAKLEALLRRPQGAHGLILFAHGTGSGRHSPRNNFVAEELEREGFASLLMDLLTSDEEEADVWSGKVAFDIERLTRRLVAASEWAAQQAELRDLPLGYFGASTGAAAALLAAHRLKGRVRAIVSRGGRPDLAGEALSKVDVPSLLIVGGEDTSVIALNRQALAKLRGPKHLAVVPGATHLFEEPGALERAAELASRWFSTRLKHGEVLR